MEPARRPPRPSGMMSGRTSRRSRGRCPPPTTSTASAGSSRRTSPSFANSSSSRPTSGTRRRTPRSCGGRPTRRPPDGCRRVDRRRAGRGQVLQGHRPGFVVGDVRAIPFRDGSVDAVYSMGTIEHFEEYAQAVREIFRILAAGRHGDRRRAQQARPVPAAAAGPRAEPRGTLRLRDGEVVHARRAPASAGVGRLPGHRAHGHPLHPRLAPDAGPVAPHPRAPGSRVSPPAPCGCSPGCTGAFPPSGATGT